MASTRRTIFAGKTVPQIPRHTYLSLTSQEIYTVNHRPSLDSLKNLTRLVEMHSYIDPYHYTLLTQKQNEFTPVGADATVYVWFLS